MFLEIKYKYDDIINGKFVPKEDIVFVPFFNIDRIYPKKRIVITNDKREIPYNRIDFRQTDKALNLSFIAQDLNR